MCTCNDGYVQQDNIHCIPETCGNDVIEAPEECDGENLGNATCEGLGFYGGTLHCSTYCRFDTSDCGGTCGDGVVQTGYEKCDDGKNGVDTDGCTDECMLTCDHNTAITTGKYHTCELTMGGV